MKQELKVVTLIIKISAIPTSLHASFVVNYHLQIVGGTIQNGSLER